ncbi:MAG: hypothetical protein WC881_11615 [Elusimicrobiota bacterium]|jgi:hypothetical protein
MRLAILLGAALGLGGCVAVPGTMDEDHLASRSNITGEVFPALDAGASEQQSLHFLVRAYGSAQAQQIADIAENAYSRIMVDTGLSSFKPLGGLYKLVVYANPEEYQRKTAQPSWSGGVSVGNAIYSYAGGQLDRVVSHEMTHLIFYEYMGRTNLEHRWINEGLAVFEENKAGQPPSGGASPPQMPRPAGWQPLAMESMLHMVPASEREYNVNAWYYQAESMVRFMIERGGRIGFGQFLAAIRQDVPLDKAMPGAFPGVWRDLTDYEQSWRKAQL